MAVNLEALTKQKEHYTALLYCAPGVGKSTAIGLIAERSEGKTLVLDVDRTIVQFLFLEKEAGKLEYDTIAVDNISELERCILSDLGSQGKNKGVPAQADYQYMQFKLVNSLRYLKSLGVNVILTAWETVRDIVHPDGTSYSQFIPKISLKIVDNICGLCDVVGKILAKQDGTRGIVLEATQSIYAKNQLDSRKGCLVEDFIKKEEKTKKE